MRRRSRQLVLAMALWGSLAAGCDWMGKRQPYPPDPLLISRKPVEARDQKTEPVLVARTEPASPDPPSEAVASAPVQLRESKTGLAKRPTDAGLTATPASRPGGPSGVPVSPAVRRRSGD